MPCRARAAHLSAWILFACADSDDPAVSRPIGETPAPQPTETGHQHSGADTARDTGPDTGNTGAAFAVGPHRITVTGAPADAVVVCRAAAEPLEHHERPVVAGEAVVAGLLGGTEYRCELTGTSAPAAATLTTPPDAVTVRWSIDDHDPTRSHTGYTLFNHGRSDDDHEPHELILVDPEGRVRWSKFLHDEFPDCDAQILLPEGTLLYGGGQGITPTIESLDGTVLWQAPARPFDERYHHHAERLPSGEILTMTTTVDSGGADTWTGFQIERIDPTGAVTWSWSSQGAVDRGDLPTPPVGEDDPWHANSVAVDAAGTTYVNLRQASWLLAIDPAGALLWRLGPDGDFSLVDAAGQPLPRASWFFGAHAPEHHGDRILFHDNGWTRPGSPAYSRALELRIDPNTKTATPTWDWREDGWYEPIWGDIDELPAGTTLITRGHCGACDPADTSQIVEVHRDSGDVVWRLRFADNQDATYRAQRVGGCELFDNRRYCP